MRPRRIAVLTGGGDTSALNATIRGILDRASAEGVDVIGFRRGWAGLLDGGDAVELSPDLVDPSVGGTVLKTSRTKLGSVPRGFEQARRTLRRLNVDALAPIGGDDTLSVAAELADVPMVVVTKTIDNDVGANPPAGDPVDFSRMVNYFTPGFPSAARRVAEFVAAVRTTAYSHERIVLVESMGMSAGWLALAAAWGHADLILIPERPLDYARLRDAVADRYRADRHCVVCVAEGLTGPAGRPVAADESNLDAFGHPKLGGAAAVLAERLKVDLSEALGTGNFNAVIPSYLYRSGPPSDVDRALALRLGALAVELLLDDRLDHMACVGRQGDGLDVVGQPFGALDREADGAIRPRRVDPRFYDADAARLTPVGEDYFRPILGDRPDPIRMPDLAPVE